jgi:hypothetical protein
MNLPILGMPNNDKLKVIKKLHLPRKAEMLALIV